MALHRKENLESTVVPKKEFLLNLDQIGQHKTSSTSLDAKKKKKKKRKTRSSKSRY
jgi:hypothetical protein